jgi:hypothetical protein
MTLIMLHPFAGGGTDRSIRRANRPATTGRSLHNEKTGLAIS